MQLTVEAKGLLVQTDGQSNAQGVAVFQSNRALYTGNIGGKGDVIVVGLHGIPHHS